MSNLIIYLKRSFILELKKAVAYPASFWLVFFTIPLYSVIQIVFLETIYSQTNNFAGYSKYEGYILFGTYELVMAISHFFLYLRLSDLKSLIRGGDLESFDFALTKPIDSQIYGTLGRFSFGNLGPLIVSFLIIYYGLSHEPHLLTSLTIISYILTIFLGVFIFYLGFLFFSTFLFWSPELQMTEYIWESVRALGQYPSALYRGTMGVIFNLIIPLTLMASIPVEFLLGKRSFYEIIIYLLIVIVLFLLTRLFWNYAIKGYSSSSS